MYRASTGHRFMLVVTDKVTYLVTITLYIESLYDAGEALINYVFCKYGPLGI